MVEVSGQVGQETRSEQNNIVRRFIHDFHDYSTLAELANSKFFTTNSYLTQLLSVLNDYPEIFHVNPKFGKPMQNRAFKTDPLLGFVDFIVEGIQKGDKPALKISQSEELISKVGYSFIIVEGGGEVRGSDRNNIPGKILNSKQMEAFNEFLSKANLPVDEEL